MRNVLVDKNYDERLEDILPYLDLNQVDEKTRRKFIIDYKNMVYESQLRKKGFKFWENFI